MLCQQHQHDTPRPGNNQATQMRRPQDWVGMPRQRAKSTFLRQRDEKDAPPANQGRYAVPTCDVDLSSPRGKKDAPPASKGQYAAPATTEREDKPPTSKDKEDAPPANKGRYAVPVTPGRDDEPTIRCFYQPPHLRKKSSTTPPAPTSYIPPHLQCPALANFTLPSTNPVMISTLTTNTMHCDISTKRATHCPAPALPMQRTTTSVLSSTRDVLAASADRSIMELDRCPAKSILAHDDAPNVYSSAQLNKAVATGYATAPAGPDASTLHNLKDFSMPSSMQIALAVPTNRNAATTDRYWARTTPVVRPLRGPDKALINIHNNPISSATRRRTTLLDATTTTSSTTAHDDLQLRSSDILRTLHLTLNKEELKTIFPHRIIERSSNPQLEPPRNTLHPDYACHLDQIMQRSLGVLNHFLQEAGSAPTFSYATSKFYNGKTFNEALYREWPARTVALSFETRLLKRIATVSEALNHFRCYEVELLGQAKADSLQEIDHAITSPMRKDAHWAQDLTDRVQAALDLVSSEDGNEPSSKSTLASTQPSTPTTLAQNPQRLLPSAATMTLSIDHTSIHGMETSACSSVQDSTLKASTNQENDTSISAGFNTSTRSDI
jgi:hypothetical protein